MAARAWVPPGTKFPQGARRDPPCGHSTSFAELDPGNVGVAVPICSRRRPTGLSRPGVPRMGVPIIDKALMLQVLKDAASQITVRMTQSAHGVG